MVRTIIRTQFVQKSAMTNSGSAPGTRDATFGLWLKERRNALGLTREELAARVDCSPETIYKIESGSRRPSRQIAEIVAGVFGIPSDEREAFVGFARGQGAAAHKDVGPESVEHPWRASQRRLTNLPAQVTSFIGRERDVEQVRALLLRDTVRMLTLVGPPGIGKTRLALEVAAHLVNRLEGGVYFVPLAPVSDPALVVPTIAKTLGLTDSTTQSMLDALAQRLRDKRLLLVLDNFEQVVDAGPFVAHLLAECPWLKVLVTSRETLHLYGERHYPVPPLEVPVTRPVAEHDLTELGNVSSVALFVERAMLARPDFVLSEENAEAVARVCAHLGGLPLAIELAAARVRLFTPQAMLAVLADSLSLLAGGARDLPLRHQTLRAAIEWSYNFLDADEQRLFRRLGVFTGGCTLVAAEAVCNPRGDIPGGATAGLESLIDKSLLQLSGQPDGPTGETRFYMLETIREYAWQGLAESEEAHTLERLHAQYYLALAEAAEPELRGPQQAEWMNRLQGEYDNLRAALTWGTGSGGAASSSEGQEAEKAAPDLAVRISSALGRFWLTRGYVTEGRHWINRVLAGVDFEAVDLLRPWHLNALNLAGVMAASQGDSEGAQAFVERSLGIARALGDKPNMARSLNGVGIIARRQGNYALAEEYLTECLHLYRSLGDKVWTAGVLGNLAIVAHIRGKYEEARGYSAESILLRRELGDKTGMAIALGNLANMCREDGDFAQARELLDEARTLCEEVGNPRQRLHVLAALGQLLCDKGDYEEAAPLLQESLELTRTTGEQSQTGSVLTSLGRIALDRGDHSAARLLFQDALAYCLQAREHGAELVDILEWIALLEAAQGSAESASRRYERTVTLLSAVAARREEMGAPVTPIKRQNLAQTTDSMRAALGESAFDRAWAVGQAMGLGEAVTYALGTNVEAGL